MRHISGTAEWEMQKNFGRKYEVKVAFGRLWLRRRWQDNIKVHFREREREWTKLRFFCEYGDKCWGSIKAGYFLTNWMTDWLLLEKILSHLAESTWHFTVKLHLKSFAKGDPWHLYPLDSNLRGFQSQFGSGREEKIPCPYRKHNPSPLTTSWHGSFTQRNNVLILVPLSQGGSRKVADTLLNEL